MAEKIEEYYEISYGNKAIYTCLVLCFVDFAI